MITELPANTVPEYAPAEEARLAFVTTYDAISNGKTNRFSDLNHLIETGNAYYRNLFRTQGNNSEVLYNGKWQSIKTLPQEDFQLISGAYDMYQKLRRATTEPLINVFQEELLGGYKTEFCKQQVHFYEFLEKNPQFLGNLDPVAPSRSQYRNTPQHYSLVRQNWEKMMAQAAFAEETAMGGKRIAAGVKSAEELFRGNESIHNTPYQ